MRYATSGAKVELITAGIGAAGEFPFEVQRSGAGFVEAALIVVALGVRKNQALEPAVTGAVLAHE